MEIDSQLSDETLAAKAQAGDMNTFEELVSRHEKRVFHFLMTCCRNESDARDLCQETFVAAFRNLEKFDPAKSFCTWLFTIARRKSIDHHRWNRPVRGEALPELEDADDPAILLERRQSEQDLWESAQRVLPKNQYQTLWLKYVEEMSVREISQIMGKTQTHIKVLLFRARTSLAREIETQRARELAPLKNRSTADENSFEPETLCTKSL